MKCVKKAIKKTGSKPVKASGAGKKRKM